MEYNSRLYKSLSRQRINKSEYSLVPIRYEDRLDIMHWRNEQIYHLRQNKLLTENDQDKYFRDVVDGLFDQEQPGQILFSLLKDDICIGYGGLVHINWIDRHAEISFIMQTSLEKDCFSDLWTIFLGMIEEVAFNDLRLHKIFTYAYDLRPHLYPVLEAAGYVEEAKLKEHYLFEGIYRNVLIHAKRDERITLRQAAESDIHLTFKWATHPDVRKYALTTNLISEDEHREWFTSKIKQPSCIYLIAEYINQAIGSIRFDLSEEGDAKISYLLDPAFFGKGLGTRLLEEGILYCRTDGRIKQLTGEVIAENTASNRVFQKLGFENTEREGNLFTYKLYI